MLRNRMIRRQAICLVVMATVYSFADALPAVASTGMECEYKDMCTCTNWAMSCGALGLGGAQGWCSWNGLGDAVACEDPPNGYCTGGDLLVVCELN